MEDGAERNVNWKAFALLGAGLLLVSWVGSGYLLMTFRGNIEKLRFNNVELAKENASLKQTADYYYRSGMALQRSGDLIGAVSAYNELLTQFPTNALVREAGQRINELNAAIKQKMREELAEQARAGEYIDYADFYVKAKDTGLTIGKRYRFRAEIDETLLLSAIGSSDHGFSQTLIAVRDFDDPADYEKLLRNSGRRNTYDIVASMGDTGLIHIHKID